MNRRDFAKTGFALISTPAMIANAAPSVAHKPFFLDGLLTIAFDRIVPGKTTLVGPSDPQVSNLDLRRWLDDHGHGHHPYIGSADEFWSVWKRDWPFHSKVYIRPNNVVLMRSGWGRERSGVFVFNHRNGVVDSASYAAKFKDDPLDDFKVRARGSLQFVLRQSSLANS